MAVVRQKSYEGHVSCSICMDMLVDPRALPCMHTFCLTCLNTYITGACKTEKEMGFKCPVCKTFTKPPFRGMHPYSWAENYPLNFALQGIADEMKAKITKNQNDDQLLRISTEVKGKEKEPAMSTCTNHSDRPIDFECLDHGIKICSMCAALNHRKCDDVHFLGNANTSDTTEAGSAHPGISETSKPSKTVLKDLDPCHNVELLKMNEEEKDTANCTVADRRSKHKLVSRLSETASENDNNSIKAIDPADLADDFARAKPISQAETGATGDSAEWQPPTRLSNDQAHSMEACEFPFREGPKESILSTAERKPVPKRSKFNEKELSQTSLNDILEEDEDVISVTVDQNLVKTHVSLSNEIYVRTQTDQKCCSISDICLMPDGKFLVADEANSNVKLFNGAGVYQAHLYLYEEPWGIAGIEQFEAVITCPVSKSLHFILIQDTLILSKIVELDKKCYGTAYNNGEIFIAMDNEIRVISYDGKTLHKITNDCSKRKLLSVSTLIPRPLFRNARYVSVHNSHEGETIVLVSDTGKACVTAMKRGGQVISRLKLEGGGNQRGVSFGTSGEYFVCQLPNKLVAISSDEHGNRIKPLLELDEIQSVRQHAVSNCLWVSRRENNFVSVYSKG